MAQAKSAAKEQVGNPTQPIPAEERQRMIAEAAYFRALSRGFTGGDPLEDWLTAEQEIDRTSRGQEASPEKRAAS